MLRCQRVNPIHHDPALLLTLPQSSERWLLDCGDLHRLSLHDLQHITTVLISHAHIDHWIGLDALLRAQLFVPHNLRILGPRGLLAMIQGRLTGYAWNLVSRSEFRVTGYEWTGQHWLRQSFPCAGAFEGDRPEPAELPDLSDWTLKWVELEHGVPCLGYRLESPVQYRFDKNCPYRPGPWIDQAKQAIRGSSRDTVIEVEGQELGVEALREWLHALPTRQLAYITDTRLHPRMREIIAEAFGPTRWLWCEAAFLESQRPLAEEKLHATAAEAAQLAQRLECQQLHLFHLSRRTQGLADEHLLEARSIFANTVVDAEFFS
jgi:ribonuclease Z